MDPKSMNDKVKRLHIQQNRQAKIRMIPLTHTHTHTNTYKILNSV